MTSSPPSEIDRPTGWQLTLSGRLFHFDPIDPDQLNIEDIAHALGNMCRWGGHVTEFYSVAQHSVLASKLTNAKFALVALMLDASEAYIGDMIRPLKRIMPSFGLIEERIMHAAAVRFGFDWPMPDEVAEVDNALLVAEHMQFRPEAAAQPSIWDPQCSGELLARIGEITPWGPTRAKAQFLKRFYQLTEKQQQADMFQEMERQRQAAMAIPLATTSRKLYICECGHERTHHKKRLFIDMMDAQDTYHECQVDECACAAFNLKVTVG